MTKLNKHTTPKIKIKTSENYTNTMLNTKTRERYTTAQKNRKMIMTPKREDANTQKKPPLPKISNSLSFIYFSFDFF